MDGHVWIKPMVYNILLTIEWESEFRQSEADRAYQQGSYANGIWMIWWCDTNLSVYISSNAGTFGECLSVWNSESDNSGGSIVKLGVRTSSVPQGTKRKRTATTDQIKQKQRMQLSPTNHGGGFPIIRRGGCGWEWWGQWPWLRPHHRDLALTSSIFKLELRPLREKDI